MTWRALSISPYLTDFDSDRTIMLDNVPEGEFSLMNYRSANDFNPPFKVTTTIDETSPFKVGITLKAGGLLKHSTDVESPPPPLPYTSRACVSIHTQGNSCSDLDRVHDLLLPILRASV
jgi:hypothetical protein